MVTIITIAVLITPHGDKLLTVIGVVALILRNKNPNPNKSQKA